MPGFAEELMFLVRWAVIKPLNTNILPDHSSALHLMSVLNVSSNKVLKLKSSKLLSSKWQCCSPAHTTGSFTLCMNFGNSLIIFKCYLFYFIFFLIEGFIYSFESEWVRAQVGGRVKGGGRGRSRCPTEQRVRLGAPSPDLILTWPELKAEG